MKYDSIKEIWQTFQDGDADYEHWLDSLEVSSEPLPEDFGIEEGDE